jgi:hypothetical protein
MISAVYRQTMLLTYAPDEMRGRLQGVFFAVVAGGPRLGDLRAGTMAQFTSTAFSWVTGGIAAAVVAVLIGVCFPKLRRYRPVTAPEVGDVVADVVAEAAAPDPVPNPLTRDRHAGDSAD